MEDIQTIAAVPSKELPACPVETTLTLISDQVENSHPPGPDAGDKRFGELKKSIGNVSQKDADHPAAPDGGERPADPHRLRRGTAPGGVHIDRAGYSLKPVLDAMWKWGEEYKVKNG